MLPDLWAVVLAGGAGRRLARLTGGIPKQDRAFRDGPTLVEDTARRIAPLSPSDHRVTVVDASHEGYVESLRYRRALGHVVLQPADRGTLPGVLLGLTPVLASDPDAIVLITPADHGVTHLGPFEQGILSAASFVQSGVRDIVLFGIEPATPAPDYGWITPKTNGACPVGHFARVDRFTEKPEPAEADCLFKSGSVWNTMVLVGRASAVFAECQRQLPDIAAVFLAARREPEPRRTAFLAGAYRSLPAADFSRDVVAHARGLALFTWPGGMGWSDLGTPERLRAWRAGPVSQFVRTSRRHAAVPMPGVA